MMPGARDVVIEPVRSAADAASAEGRATEQWRVVSPHCGDTVVVGKPAAIDAALARIDGTDGQVYIREQPDDEPVRFNPAGG